MILRYDIFPLLDSQRFSFWMLLVCVQYPIFCYRKFCHTGNETMTKMQCNFSTLSNIYYHFSIHLEQRALQPVSQWQFTTSILRYYQKRSTHCKKRLHCPDYAYFMGLSHFSGNNHNPHIHYYYRWNKKTNQIHFRFAVVYLILPETEGRSLEEIETYFSNKKRRLNDIHIPNVFDREKVADPRQNSWHYAHNTAPDIIKLIKN